MTWGTAVCHTDRKWREIEWCTPLQMAIYIAFLVNCFHHNEFVEGFRDHKHSKHIREHERNEEHKACMSGASTVVQLREISHVCMCVCAWVGQISPRIWPRLLGSLNPALLPEAQHYLWKIWANDNLIKHFMQRDCDCSKISLCNIVVIERITR